MVVIISDSYAYFSISINQNVCNHYYYYYGLILIPAIFSHTGQIHEAFKTFVKEQIRFKLEAFEGEAKRSKVKSHINW